MSKTYIFTINLFFQIACISGFSQETNSIGMKMISIPEGKFLMGSAGYGENYDESPAHAVRISKFFNIAATEVTNAQYELFDPEHKKLRGKRGFSIDDDEAVIFVNYTETLAFCKWLSKKEGKTYRLPTEAEWEYACRANTFTAYSTGDALPKEYQKNQEMVWSPKPVSLKVAIAPPNGWGLYDMHGNVEEWCYDWYGPYEDSMQTDPAGRVTGLFRVTRGGSHSTPLRYLRSANRMGMIPEDKSWLVGFRVVQVELPSAKPLPSPLPPFNMQKVQQTTYKWVKQEKPVFMEPVNYIHKPLAEPQVPFYTHNHCPAVTFCTNGDLLAIWFSTDDEAGREMTILASRLRAGQKEWDKPSLFFKVPDRNMTGSSLFTDKTGNMYYMNGVETAGSWQNLAMVLRTSKDNGATWSASEMAVPEHAMRNQVIASMFQSREGWLIQVGDATPGGEGGTAIHISKDKGKTWYNPYTNSTVPDYKEGKSGGLIAGIHAGVVQLKNGDLMAFGRGNNIEGKNGSGPRMPMSISKDMGKSWTYSASEFPPIAGGQRLVLRRLNEGPILLVSFTNHPEDKKKGILFKDERNNEFTGYGMFAAISYDEGKTWPMKKLLTNGEMKYMYGGAWTGFFEMNSTSAEPRGYLAATQTPDNMIHLLSSSIYYRFNLGWIEKAPESVNQEKRH